MTNKEIYLDNAATTRVDDDVLQEIIPYMSNLYSNPSSKHSAASKVERSIASAREKVASLINSEPKEIIFTSGATESINTLLKSLSLSNTSKRNQIITSVTEHSAVIDTCEYLEQQGVEVTYLPVQKSGLIDLELLKNSISQETLLVCIMHVNNETGVIQPIKEITEIAHQSGALMMTDATQSVGKLPIDIVDLDIDFLIFSGHKFHSPKGIGGYYYNSRNLKHIIPLLHGGGQEMGKRSGTLNVPGIVGLGKSAEISRQEIKGEKNSTKKLRDQLENELLSIEGAFLNGDKQQRIHNITNICFPGVDADIMIKMLQEICVSNGSACTAKLIEPSYVLKAMGLSDKDAFSSIRFSLSKYNTEEEIIHTIERVKEITTQLKTF